jgi:hypothetical protein
MVRVRNTYEIHGTVYTVLVGISEGKSFSERPRNRWEDNIIDHLDIEYESVNWIHSFQDRGAEEIRFL